MGQELVRVPCPECGSSGEADSRQSRWQCTSCGSGFFLRRCSACARVSYVHGLQGFRLPWPCTWCGQFNVGFSQNQDPGTASAAELAAETVRYGPPGGPAGPGPSGQGGSAPVTHGDPGHDGDPEVSGPALATGAGTPGAPPPGPGAPSAGSHRWRARRLTPPMTAVVACAAAAAVLTTGGSGATGMAAGPPGQGSPVRGVHVTASRVGTIDFQGVPGQLIIVGTASGQVTLTGQLRGAGRAPAVERPLVPAAPCHRRRRGVMMAAVVPAAAGSAGSAESAPVRFGAKRRPVFPARCTRIRGREEGLPCLDQNERSPVSRACGT